MSYRNQSSSLQDDYTQNLLDRLIDQRERLQVEVKGMEDALKRNEKNLEDLQKQLVREGENYRKAKAERLVSQRIESEQKGSAAQRTQQERDAKLRQRLIELAERMEPLVSRKQQEIKVERYKANRPDVVVAVRIYYVENFKEGTEKRLQESKIYVCSVRIKNDTTFQQLKDYAKQYWRIDSPTISLRASNKAHLDLLLNEPVAKTILDQRMRPELWLFECNQEATSTLTEGDMFVNAQQNQQKRETASYNRELDEEGKAANYKKFIEHFRGLQHNLPAEHKVDDSAQINRLNAKDTSCPTIVFVFLMILFTFLIHSYGANTKNSYYLNSQIYGQLTTQFPISETEASENEDRSINYYEISTTHEIQSFVKYSVGNFFFDQDNQQDTKLRDFFKVIGPLRIRVVRTQEGDCDYEGIPPDYEQQIVCYKSSYSSNKFKEDILLEGETDPQEHNIFQDEDMTDINHTVFGEFHSYDGSGYVLDFPPSYDIGEYRRKINEVFSYWKSDGSIRAYIIAFTLFSPNTGLWTTTDILIEIAANGIVRPNYIVINTFLANLDENPVTKVALDAVICRATFSLYFLFLAFRIVNERQENGKRNWKYLISLNFIIDIGIFLISCIGLGLSALVDIDADELINQYKYHDVVANYLGYKTLLALNSWVMLLLMVRVIQVLRLNIRLNLMLMNIEIALRNILTYLLTVFPILLSFIYLGVLIWGPYDPNYRGLDWSFLFNLQLYIGGAQSDYQSRINTVWTPIFYTIFFLFVIFQMTGGIVGIYMDAYRLVRMNVGYRDDISPWNATDYIVWTLGFLPPNKVRGWIESWNQKRKEARSKRDKDWRKEYEEELDKSKKKSRDRAQICISRTCYKPASQLTIIINMQPRPFLGLLVISLLIEVYSQGEGNSPFSNSSYNRTQSHDKKEAPISDMDDVYDIDLNMFSSSLFKSPDVDDIMAQYEPRQLYAMGRRLPGSHGSDQDDGQSGDEQHDADDSSQSDIDDGHNQVDNDDSHGPADRDENNGPHGPADHDENDDHNGPADHDENDDHNGPADHDENDDHNGPADYDENDDHNGPVDHDENDDHNGPADHDENDDHNGPADHDDADDRCPAKCKVCDFEICDECKNNYYLYENSECIQNCPQNYYKVEDPIQACIACTDIPHCLTCSPTGACTDCASGFFIQAGKCKSCQNRIPNCQECQNAQACDICKSGFYITAEKQCVDKCPKGSYEGTSNPLTCKDCSSVLNCDVCQNQSKCAKCEANYYLRPNGTCKLTCPDTYYPDSSTRECTKCNEKFPNCNQCSTSQCTQCELNYFLNHNSSCTDTCPQGQYGNTDTGLCDLCSNALSNCLKCNKIGTRCQECDNGFYLKDSDRQCYPCSNIQGCQQCTTNQANPDQAVCTQCSSSLYLQIPPTACNSQCPDNQYKDTTNPKQCKPCNIQNCDKCEEFVPKCAQCSQGFFWNEGSSKCESCSKYGSCIKCNIQSCTECAPSLVVQPDGQSCDTGCPSGYFENSGKCEACIQNCDICSNNQTCSSCYDGFFKNSNDHECKACSSVNPNCFKCEIGEVCTECQESFYIFDNKCLNTCPEGYYGDQEDNPSCKQCIDKFEHCLECEHDGSKCVDCEENYFLDSGLCITSPCTPGQYVSSTNPVVCTDCSQTFPGCKLCSSSQKCQQCQEGQYLQLNGQVCDTTCPSGFYKGTTQPLKCKPCDLPDCIECSEDGTKCTKCINELYVDQNGVCVSNCSEQSDNQCQSGRSGNYFNGISIPKVCEKCDTQFSNCEECCSNAEACTKCKETYYLQPNGTCGLTCPGTYYPNSFTMQCEKCSEKFSNCNLCSTSQCTQCQSNYFLNDDASCTETCPQGQYGNTDTGSCDICSNVLQNCLICNHFGTECSNCDNGYYLKDSDLQCYPCSNIEGCEECRPDEEICTKCSDSLYLQVPPTTCDSQCPDSYYKDNTNPKQCKFCSLDNCDKCEEFELKCAECSLGFFWNEGSLECESCSKFGSCLECEVSGCTVCSENLLVQTDGTCDAQCKSSEYSESGKCFACFENCVNCSNSSTCNVCQVGFYRDEGGLKCEPCSNIPNCSKCQSDQICTQCINNFYLYENESDEESEDAGDIYSCVAECPAGFYNDDSGIPSCKKCNLAFDFCSECTKDHCTKCQTYYKVQQSQCVFSPCDQGQFIASVSPVVCQPCNLAIQGCDDCTEDGQICHECESGQYLQPDQTCNNACPVGYYKGDQKCESCENLDNCLECNEFGSECTKCAAGLYLDPNGVCVSFCPEGYFKGTGDILKCEQCSTKISNCNKCNQSGEECTECTNPFYIQPDQKSCGLTCPDTSYYDSNETLKCVTCSYTFENCLKCSSNECSQCSLEFYLYENTQCVNPCPSGWFGSGSYQYLYENEIEMEGGEEDEVEEDTDVVVAQCKQCNTTLSNCTVCNQIGTECHACEEGYYLDPDDKKCFSCMEGCQNCEEALVCDECLEGLFKYDNQCIPECPTGYYQDKDSKLCQECSNKFENCDKCDQEGNDCTECEAGYYYSSDDKACYQCSQIAGCVDCNTTGCTECSTPQIVQPNGESCDFDCPSGYFNEYVKCVNCIDNCSYCQNNHTCINCNDNFYWDSESSQCDPCSNIPNCSRCENDRRQCNECIDNFYLYENESDEESEDAGDIYSCVAECPAGYYNDDSGIPSCKTCNLAFDFCSECTKDQCTKCQTYYKLQQSQCVFSPCDQGQFIASVSPVVCQPCNLAIQGCDDCTEDGHICHECESGQYLQPDQTCNNACPVGFYKGDQKCESCEDLDNCLECNEFGSECTKCAAGLYLDPNGVCVSFCPDGYFKGTGDILRCEQCSTKISNCNKCSQSGEECTECTNPFYIQPDQKSCGLTCPEQYHKKTESPYKCVECSQTYPNCKICTESECKLCIFQYFLQDDNSCKDSCPEGQFKSNQYEFTYSNEEEDQEEDEEAGNDQSDEEEESEEDSDDIDEGGNNDEPPSCKLCNAALENCAICNEFGSECTKCESGYYIKNSSNKCFACSEGCEDCSDNTSCNKCSEGLFKYQGNCLSECPTGYYQDPTSKSCKKCKTKINKCEECDQQGTECTKCESGTFFSPEDLKCVSCQQLTSCLECDANGCSKCQESLFIQPTGTCNNKCPKGYFADDGKCSTCFNTCQECSTGTTCDNCSEGYYLSTEDKQCNQCSDIQNCDKCATDLPQCKDCNEGFYLKPDYSCSNECDEGYYKDQSSPKSCKECSDNCKNCDSNSSECDVCFEGHYKKSSDNLCYPCSEIDNCLECDDDKSCTSCENGFFIQPEGNCKDSCPSEHYPSIETGKCEKCDENCKNCQENQSCSECVPGFYLHENTCRDSCPDSYFKSDDPPAKCEVCPDFCEICEEASKCLKCKPGQYLQSDGSCKTTCPEGQWGNSSNRECKECKPPCKTCEHGVEQQSCGSCSDENAEANNGECQCKKDFVEITENGVKRCGCPEFSEPGENGGCGCKAGYVQSNPGNGVKCEPCPNKCGSGLCFLDSKNKVQCTCEGENNFIQPDSTDCLPTCPAGYYKNSNNRSCEKCEPPCASCQDNQNSAKCATCEERFTLKNDKCICDPPLKLVGDECHCPANSNANENSCKCGPFYYNLLEAPQLECASCPDNCQDCALSSGVVLCSFCNGQFKPSQDKTSCEQIQLSDVSVTVGSVYQNQVSFETENVWFDLTPQTMDLLIDGRVMQDWEVTRTTGNSNGNSNGNNGNGNGGARILQTEDDPYHSSYVIIVHDKGYENIVGKVSLVLKPPGTEERIEQTVDSPNTENDDDDEKSTTEVAVQLATLIVVSTCFLVSLLSGNFHFFWCMINTIQILMFIPMTAISDMPEVLIDFLRGLIDYNPVFNMFKLFTNESSEAYNQYAERNGYDTSSFLLNSGVLLTTFSMVLVLLPILYLLLFLTCGKWQGWLRRQIRYYKWNVFTRFWIEGYLELSIAALIQVNTLAYDDWEYQMHSVSAIVVGILLAATPVIMLLFMMKYNKYYRNSDDENFKMSWDSVYGEFRKSSKMSLWFYYWFIIRRGIYAVTQILLADFAGLQVLINIGHSLLNFLFILIFRPYKSTSLNRASIISEFGVFMIFGMTGLFMFDIQDREELALTIIFIVIGIFFFQILANVISIIFNRFQNTKEPPIIIENKVDGNKKAENVQVFEQSADDSSFFNHTTIMDGAMSQTQDNSPVKLFSAVRDEQGSPEPQVGRVFFKKFR